MKLPVCKRCKSIHPLVPLKLKCSNPSSEHLQGTGKVYYEQNRKRVSPDLVWITYRNWDGEAVDTARGVI